MEYTDNPRKILGRVDVIYSDTEISKDIQTTESGNSAISHPDEVFGAHLVPTVKGCTMDGNATMDGSFQMMDDSVVLGWWSGSLSGSDGVFANAPWIEIYMAAGPASYGMTDTMGRMHGDAQFAGSSSVPAHVEMMGFLGMGNNPMVGATVAVAVAIEEAMKK